MLVGPPLDVEGVATAQCYEISAKAGFRGTLIWVHGNGELPQEYTSMFDRAFLAHAAACGTATTSDACPVCDQELRPCSMCALRASV